MRKIGKILVAFAALLLIAACVTTKKKGEAPGRFQKGYHDLTAKYNYWFNADELLYLTIDKLEKQHKDNYNQLLELYPYAAADPTSSRGDLESVVKKSSMAIGMHRISEYTDDCYTMIGQAQLLKRDFETAENTFQFIKQELDPHNKKPSIKKAKKAKKEISKKKKTTSKKKKKAAQKKKKKKSASKKKSDSRKKDNGKTTDNKKAADKKTETPVVTGENPYKPGIKRTAAYPLAMVWFSRTLIERDKYNEAEYLIRELSEDQFFPNDLKSELSKAEAYLWIRQKRYDRAIPPLKNALDRTEKKRDRARLAYILYQLYDKAGNYEAAYQTLDVVLHSSPAYEMEFNARLHQIVAGRANNRLTSEEATHDLEHMTKDDKNLEYRDQIYYEMATIALADDKKPEAIQYLRKSLDYNQGNTAQRGESYLKLADLYFEAENFVKAKAYYDSTLSVLTVTDERHQRVSTFANNLTEIARLIQVIADNDSIVRVFYMDDAQRKELAKSIKKQKDAAAEAAAEAAQKNAAAAGPTPGGKLPPAIAGAGVKPSTFYFYNDAFVKKGKKDFNKAWGDRKLEDNWRRSLKISTGGGDDAAAITGADSIQADVSSNELSDIFRGIPSSEAELAVIHASTFEAMYKLGTLYRDRLQNNRRCSGTLEDMQTRYPDNEKYQPETWYYCFLAFKDLGNDERANFYLEKLRAKHPNSPFTRALTDPNFLNATKEREREMNAFYEQAYTLFQNGNYKDAFDRCEEAPKKYGSTNPLMPKFTLLSALCTGNLQGNEAYCKSLGEVIARYPESAEATRAKEIARLLACKGFEVSADKSKEKDGGQPVDNEFTLEDDKLHYFLVVLRSNDVKLDDIKATISDYNREYHRLEQLRISNIFLGTDTNTPIVVIRKFDNKAKAMAYLEEVSKKNDFLGETDKRQYTKEFFAVTQENYRRILKNRTLDGYRTFFQENYLK